MAQPGMKTISNRMVEKLSVKKDTVYWDRDLTGFGVRVYPTGSKVYVAQARGPGGPRRVTVGRHGVIGADEARKRAASIIARVKAGEEAPKPVKQSLRTHGGRTGGALYHRTRRGAVQALERRALPLGGPPPHPAGPGGDAGGGRGARAGGGASPEAVRYAPGGEPGGARSLLDVPPGGGMGDGARGDEPVPRHREVSREEAGAVPDGGGIHPPGRGARGGRGFRGRLRVRRGGHPASHSDGLPEVGYPLAALGGRVAR